MSQHSAPIVPTILFVETQRHPWKLAQITRHGVTYHTPTTVRTRDTGTMQQHHVYCIVDDAAWGRVLFAWSALQTDLNALADGLRALGSYTKRLSEAGGIKTAPNPLCPTVISAPDPDTSDEGSWFTSRLVPRIERVAGERITSHTPKMLHVERDGKPWSTTHQRDHFVCHDDAAWARIEALIAAAKAAELNWATVLVELGKYSEALADGRYARKEEPMQPSMPAGALAVTSDVRVGIAMMDQAEAREVVEQIKTQLDSARRQLLDLYEREGWKALGYTSWRACAVAEFGQSSAQIYRLLSAAQIEQAIDSPIGEIPEAHLREVGKLDTPALQRQALDRADQLAGDKPRTAKHVEQAAAEIKPKPATCIRCGAERSETRSLTSYQAGLIDAYPGREVTLCSRCIPELLRAQRAAQRESEVAAPAQPTAAPFWQSMSELHPTAHLWTRKGMNEHHAACGMVTQRAPSGSTEAGHCSSCVRAMWPQNQTAQQPTQLTPAQHLGPGQPAPSPWPLPPPGWRWRRNGGVCQLIDNADGWATANYNGPERALAEAERRMLSRAAESLGIARPAVLTRPRRPQSADVTAQLRYLDQLESYATAIERLVPTTPQAALDRAVTLIGDALDDYADQLSNAQYEALARLVRNESAVTA
jgi:hypothetical protein